MNLCGTLQLQAATLEAPSTMPSDPEPIQQTTYTLALFLQGTCETARLNLTFYDEEDASKKSGPINLSGGTAKPYKRDDPTAAGTEVWMRLSLPQDLKPGYPPSSLWLHFSFPQRPLDSGIET